MIVGIRTKLFLKIDTIYRGVGILTWKRIKVKWFDEDNSLFSRIIARNYVVVICQFMM